MKELLTEKQLINLNTDRLNNYRKKFVKKLGALRHRLDIGDATEDEFKQYKTLSVHYGEIQEVLSKREHIKSIRR